MSTPLSCDSRRPLVGNPDRFTDADTVRASIIARSAELHDRISALKRGTRRLVEDDAILSSSFSELRTEIATMHQQLDAHTPAL